jgi:hypothetical protein
MNRQNLGFDLCKRPPHLDRFLTVGKNGAAGEIEGGILRGVSG